MKSSPASTRISEGPRTSPGSAHQQRLVDALAEYHGAADSGHLPDREAFLQEYADIRDALAGYLDSFDLIRSVAPQLREPSEPTGTAADGLPQRAMLGDFEMIREIGRGGMGVVYEAEQVSVGRRVALKVLPFAAMLKSQQLDRFRNEVRAAGLLNHPHIVAVYSVGTERGVHYYAMQLVEGQSLAELITQLRGEHASATPATPSATRQTPSATPPTPSATRQTPSATRPTQSGAPVQSAETQPLALLSTVRTTQPDLFWRTVAKLGKQAAEALDHAHGRGVVHRDVKPANLLVGGDEHLWVADFGLARLETDVGMTASGDLLGTLRYMSPEQAAGDRAIVDHRTDVYSLGATLYELLALHPAFTSSDRQQILHDVTATAPLPLRKVDPRIPVDLATIVAKAMEKDPADRYATAGELATDLRNFLEHRPIAARHPSLASRARKWARRRPTLVAAVFAVLLLATLGLGLSTALIAAANQRASERQTQAEENLRIAAETIDKLLTRVGQDAQAHGQLRHADDLLRGAVASYDELLAKSDDPALVIKAASAHNRLSDLLRLGAQYGESHRVAEKGLKLLRQLPRRIADSGEALTLRASLLSASGIATLSARDYAAAEVSLRECLALRKQLCAAAPEETPCRKALLRAHNSLGVLLLESGRLEEAEKELLAAVAMSQTLPTGEQNTPSGLNRQAGLRANLAGIAVERGDYAAAEESFREAVGLQRRAVARLPEDPSMREDLYNFYWTLADVLIHDQRYDEAADEVASFSQAFPERLQAQVEGVWLLVRCIEQADESAAKRYRDLARELITRSGSASFAPQSMREDLAWLLATCPVPELRDGQRALKTAKRLCHEDAEKAMHQNVLSAAYLETENYDLAHTAAELARGFEGHGGSAYEFVLLALSQSGRGKQDDARAWYAKALVAHNEMGEHADDGLRALMARAQIHLETK